MSISHPFRRGRIIVLPVHLRHKDEVSRKMALDTGARVTIIRPEIAEKIGIELRDEPAARLVGVAGSAPVREGTIDAVSVLGHTVRGLKVACQELDADLGFDGIIGLDLIQHFNITIDNDAERITFEPRLE
ncbi:MAG: retropepsin-like aspartic protease [Planctomycetota bacterium]|jgi:predicted aspartyl protease